MKFVVPPTNFATGIDVEEQSFTWTINNFPVIRMHKAMIDSQQISFSAGTSLGHTSNWSIYLKESMSEQKRWIGIYFRIDKPLSILAAKKVYVEMSLSTGGAITWKGAVERKPLDYFTDNRGYGFPNFIQADEVSSSTEDKLIIRPIFKLYAPSKSPQPCQLTVKEFQIRSRAQAWIELSPLMRNPTNFQDILIISRDRVEFSAKQEILAVRSPVFKAMLEGNMKEANFGVIHLPDISSKALQVLLAFLSKGELLPDWSETEVIVELTNAAAKYQLPDLLKFLDGTLGNVCNLENALALFILAHELSLKKAEVELLNFIKSPGSKSPEVYCKMLKGIPVPGGNIADSPPYSETNPRLLKVFQFFVGIGSGFDKILFLSPFQRTR